MSKTYHVLKKIKTWLLILDLYFLSNICSCTHIWNRVFQIWSNSKIPFFKTFWWIYYLQFDVLNCKEIFVKNILSAKQRLRKILIFLVILVSVSLPLPSVSSCLPSHIIHFSRLYMNNHSCKTKQKIHTTGRWMILFWMH